MPWLFYGVLAVAAFYPVVFEGSTANSPHWQPNQAAVPYEGQRPKTLPVNDPAAFPLQDEPQVELVAAEIKAGRLPLWNPHVGGGAPLAAALESSAFSPLHWPLFIDPSPLTWDIFVIARLVVAAALTYYLCRLLGLGKAAALVAGALYGFGGYLVIYIQYYFIDGEVVLPAILIAIELLLRRPHSMPRLGLLGVVMALMILAGNPQVTILNGLFIGAYALTRVAFLSNADGEARGLRLGALAGGAILGVALSAFLLLPFIEYFRVAWNNHEHGVGTNTLPPSGVLSAFIPRFFGPLHQHWIGISNTRFLPYLGFAVILLAPVALARVGDRALATFRWFLVGWSAFMGLKIYGGDLLPIPGAEFPGFLGTLPGLESIHWVKYTGTLLLSTSLLAGVGVHVATTQRPRWWLLLAGPVAFVGLTAATLIFYRDFLDKPGAWGVIHNALLLAVPLMLGVIIIVLATQRGLLGPGVGAAAVALLVAIDLAVWVPKDRWDRYDAYEVRQPHVQYLLDQQGQSQPFRFYGYDMLVMPVTSGPYGLYDLRNVDSLMVDHYRDYMLELVLPRDELLTGGRGIYSLLTGGPYIDTILGNPMVDAANVRYLVVPRQLASSSEYRQVFKARGEDRQYELVLDGRFQVYENMNVLPRGFLVSHVIDVASDEEGIAALRDNAFDPATSAVVHGEVPDEFARLLTRREGSAGSFVVESYGPQEVEGIASVSSPALFVFSDTYYPGWKAYVDGEEVDIERVNLFMRGVFLEAGEHDIRFAYEPDSVLYGLVISGTALFTLVGMLAVGGVRELRGQRSVRSPGG